jgi:hypothetical protein
MLILYLAGVNNIGKQINLQIYGRVENKSIDYDDGKISGYDFVIFEEESNKRYDFPTNEKIYSMYEVDDKILIKAKRGKLGIVYDQWVYKQ